MELGDGEHVLRRAGRHRDRQRRLEAEFGGDLEARRRRRVVAVVGRQRDLPALPGVAGQAGAALEADLAAAPPERPRVEVLRAPARDQAQRLVVVDHFPHRPGLPAQQVGDDLEEAGRHLLQRVAFDQARRQLALALQVAPQLQFLRLLHPGSATYTLVETLSRPMRARSLAVTTVLPIGPRVVESRNRV